MAKNFNELTEQEILALAISLEETDGRIYSDFAEGLKTDYPATARVFEKMVVEENDHRRTLIEEYRRRFGEHIPLIRREDVRGFVNRRPVWLVRPLGIKTVRRQAEIMEMETRRFYERSMERLTDAGTRKLLGDLAEAERKHEAIAGGLTEKHVTIEAQEEEEKAEHRLFVMQVVQPGLAGLMDGSVSTLAPLFAAAFATHQSHDAFLVGLAASVGAGISMGFAESASDDGSLTGRGKPLLRGIVCGLMTTAGGIGHTLPYLLPYFMPAAQPAHSGAGAHGDPYFMTATGLAAAVVVAELLAISYIRNKYMDTPFLSAAFQVIVGGVLVFLAGILIGNA